MVRWRPLTRWNIDLGRLYQGADASVRWVSTICKTKEKATAREKDLGLTSKRKESDAARTRKPTLVKKARSLMEGSEVKLKEKDSTSNLVTVDPAKDKGKELVQEKEVSKSPSDSIKLKPFIDDVVQAFARSSSEKSTSPQTDSQKFHLAFNKSAMVFLRLSQFCL